MIRPLVKGTRQIDKRNGSRWFETQLLFIQNRAFKVKDLVNLTKSYCLLRFKILSNKFTLNIKIMIH